MTVSQHTVVYRLAVCQSEALVISLHFAYCS